MVRLEMMAAGTVDFVNVAADAFGNAIGNSIVDGQVGTAGQQTALLANEESGPRLRASAGATLAPGLDYEPAGDYSYSLIPAGSPIPRLNTGIGSDVGSGGLTIETYMNRNLVSMTYGSGVPTGSPAYVDPVTGTMSFALAPQAAIEARQLPPVASGSGEIRAYQGFTSDVGAIYNAWAEGKIGAGDALRMGYGSIRFNGNYYNNEYQLTTRAGGGLQALGGAIEIKVGAGLSSTLVGAAVGLPLIAHGTDNVQAGARTAWNGEYVKPLESVTK